MNENFFQNRYVHSTIISAAAKGNIGKVPEKGILSKDEIMSLINAKNPGSNPKKQLFFKRKNQE